MICWPKFWHDLLWEKPVADTPDSSLIENTSWVEAELPDWQHAVYSVDDESATLYTPLNTGNEGMAYLTYIVEQHHCLPEIVVSVHSHRDKQWHVDYTGWNTPMMLQNLQLDLVRRHGFVNLRCSVEPGCDVGVGPALSYPEEQREGTEHNIFAGEAWQYMFDEPLPKRLATPCCG
ncbi:MAG: hypothetical protein M1838_001144 [Thelocarpon superellum]|nr:MAG: hypothetical protein M1838_001144 [Thelocarpon superellum]